MAKQSFKPNVPSANTEIFNMPDQVAIKPATESRAEVEEKNKGGRPVIKPGRERVTLNIKTTNIELLALGRIKEEFESKSDYLDFILDEYFKDKPFKK